MPYQIECRMRTTPLDRKLDTVDQWSPLSQADWFMTKEDAEALVNEMREMEEWDSPFRYRVTFFSIGHPDEYDDQEFAS